MSAVTSPRLHRIGAVPIRLIPSVALAFGASSAGPSAWSMPTVMAAIVGCFSANASFWLSLAAIRQERALTQRLDRVCGPDTAAQLRLAARLVALERSASPIARA